ncbi:peroxisomal enoyl-CoA-hydratase [Vararia minispora EC-137]|uniref:Peroxisomal enoyl-CoA-hydratase n=1 Tax=Vararia minispora EC-137 TaxID=1314806 RepID=A0ACB8QT55_9AGAM|nr:peroxisomal enoyl-CoA-hydratase [Vararia minispora EC-137]
MSIDYKAQGYRDLLISLDRGVAVVTINRPKQRNTFGGTLPQELEAVFELLDLDDRVRVVILTADTKAPAFCSGADLSGGWGGLFHVHRDSGGKVSMAIFRCRKITIAAVNGHAVGVGVTGLQLPFDFRFVWAGAKLALPFVRRGIAVEAGASFLLPRLVGHAKATALLLTGGTFSPDSPYLQGLYHDILPTREAVLPTALAFARELAENTSMTSVASTKALLSRGVDSIEGQHLIDSRVLADLARSDDAAEGARAFIERRPVQFKDTLKNLSEHIPWWTSPDTSFRRTKL